jgi:hypothetical protein
MRLRSLFERRERLKQAEKFEILANRGATPRRTDITDPPE